jgi:GAF domain-containing protein
MADESSDGSEQALQSGLAGLQEVLGRGQPLTSTLEKVASFAASVIPGADGAGLTLLERQRPDTIVASADFVRAVDEVQYRVGEGPCLLAVEERAIQVSGSLSAEARWPHFGPPAGRLGVHSALSLPLIVGAQTVGALNVYGKAFNAFSDQSIDIGRRFSGPAAVTAAHALLLEESRRVNEQLERALTSRAVIDQAIGIVMSRAGVTAEEAFQELRTLSQIGHVKLVQVARQLVDQAVARARSRRDQGQELPASPRR